MSETRPILCGKCHVTPERGFERDGEAWAKCPICGQEARVIEIQREAAEYEFDKVARSVPGLKSGSISVKGMPQREYRWIVGD